MTIQEQTLYYVTCDTCGSDGSGSTFPTYEEAVHDGWDWETDRGGDYHLCDDCRVAAEAAANEQIILEEE